MNNISELPLLYRALARIRSNNNTNNLDGAFDWASSPEGLDFWSQVNSAEFFNQLPPLPPELELQKKEQLLEDFYDYCMEEHDGLLREEFIGLFLENLKAYSFEYNQKKNNTNT